MTGNFLFSPHPSTVRELRLRKWAGSTLHGIAQHQFHGGGVEEHLARKVRDSVFPDVVANERDGNDEGNEPPPVLVDNNNKFLFFIF